MNFLILHYPANPPDADHKVSADVPSSSLVRERRRLHDDRTIEGNGRRRATTPRNRDRGQARGSPRERDVSLHRMTSWRGAHQAVYMYACERIVNVVCGGILILCPG